MNTKSISAQGSFSCPSVPPDRQSTAMNLSKQGRRKPLPPQPQPSLRALREPTPTDSSHNMNRVPHPCQALLNIQRKMWGTKRTKMKARKERGCIFKLAGLSSAAWFPSCGPVINKVLQSPSGSPLRLWVRVSRHAGCCRKDKQRASQVSRQPGFKAGEATPTSWPLDPFKGL